MNTQAAPNGRYTELGFEVEKISCAGCVGRAEKALAAVPGVVAARVNLATHRAEVTARPEAGLTDLQTALRRAGYPMRVHTLEFDVGNMSCGSCIARVEQALAMQPGGSARQCQPDLRARAGRCAGPRRQRGIGARADICGPPRPACGRHRHP